MSRLLQDLRYAVRSFSKAPGFTAVAIVVLALGIGANSATFTIVNALLFRPVPTQGEGIVGLYRSERSRPDAFRAFAYPNFIDVREQNDVFASLAGHTFAMAGTRAGDSTRRIFVELITSNYFETLGVPLAAGRPFTADEERPRANVPVAVVSYDRWAASGFDSSFIGSSITINATEFTVVGVAPRGFTGSIALVAPDVWLPLGVFDIVGDDRLKGNADGLADRKAGTLTAIGRLKNGLTIETASQRLDLLARELGAADPDNKDQALMVARLPRMSSSTSPSTDAGLGVASAALMGLAGTVLLIACLNLANMLLARGTQRRREMAIRLAIGGARGRIVRQLLTESLLLAAVGAAAGLLVAYWSTGFIVGSLARVLPMTLVFDPTPDLNVLLATAAFVGIATVLAGIGPALKLSRLDLASDLKQQVADTIEGRRAFSARNVLVVAQLALSLALLAAGGLFARSAFNAAGTDPGFSYDGAIVATLDPGVAQMSDVRSREIYRRVLERVRRMPGIAAASIASTVPFGSVHEGRYVERPGIPRNRTHNGPTYRVIGADYFKSLGLEMVKGREFTAVEEDSATAPRVAIIDTALAAQLFPNEDPVGQMIRFSTLDQLPYTPDPEPLQVVGVSRSVREELLNREEDAHIFVPYGRNYRAAMHVHVKTVDPGTAAVAAALDSIRRELRAIDPQLPVLELTTFRRLHENGLELWAVRTGARVLMVFGLLALGLAVAGVYGVKSYLISRRRREIGIRMALGARPSDVLGLVMRESALLTLAGLGIGLPLALAAGRVLSAVLLDVSGFDPLVFVTAPLLLTAASLVASYIPARRATAVDSLSALRGE